MIHEHITARGAGFVRAWTFALWAVYLVGSDTASFARVPDLEFDPPGVLKLLPGSFYDLLLTVTGLTMLKWVLLLAVIACAFGVRPWRRIAIPTVVLLTLYQGISRGLFGYMNHKELGALYVTYILAVFPATGFSPFAPRTTTPPGGQDAEQDSEQDAEQDAEQGSEQDQATLRMMMLLATAAMLISYCLVGVNRLANSDMSMWSGDTFAYFMVRTSYGTNWFDNASISEAFLTRPWLLQLLAISFPIGTIIEVLAPLCLVHKRFRYLWIVSIVGLHALTWATMDILFWENMVLFPVLLLDGEWVLTKLDRLRGRIGVPADSETPARVREDELASRPA